MFKVALLLFLYHSWQGWMIQKNVFYAGFWMNEITFCTYLFIEWVHLYHKINFSRDAVLIEPCKVVRES